MAANLPAARSRAAAAGVPGGIYVYGGVVGGAVTGSTLLYDVALDSYTVKPSMITARSLTAGVRDEHGIWGIGGATSLSSTSTATGTSTTEVLVLLEATGWTEGPNLPAARSRAAAAEVNGRRIYLGLGIVGGAVTSSWLLFDERIGSYTAKASKPTATALSAAVWHSTRDEIYVPGGATSLSSTSTATGTSTNEVYGVEPVVLAPASISLDPSTASLEAGATHTVIATVRDQYGDPVAGVEVSFSRTGANPTATPTVVVTDASGLAAFSYAGSAAGEDEITATAAGGLSDTATATWSAGIVGGGGGLRNVLSGEPVHMVISERGVARWPIVDGFEASDSYAGGWKAAKGKISRAEFDAYPNVYAAGATWYVFDRQYGTLLYRSELSEPVESGGSVDIAGRGPGAALDENAPRLLFSANGGDEWADGGAEPFEYANSKKIGLDVGERGIVWTIDKDRTFVGGEVCRAVFYAEGFDGLSSLAYRVRKDAHHGNLELVLSGRNVREAGDYQAPATELAVWSLGGLGVADGADLEHLVSGGEYDLFELALRTTGPFTAGDDIEISARRLGVGGVSEDRETTADDVFAEVFDRIGCDVIRIEPNGTPVHPIDHKDGSYASLLDSIAQRIDYLYRVYWEGGKLVGEAGTWGSNRYSVLDPEIPRDLIPLQRFDRVTVVFTYPNGAPGRVRVRSDGVRLPVPKDAPTIRITGKPMDDEAAELTAGILADRLVTRRWSGSGQALQVVDETGSAVHANIIRAGDVLYYPDEAAEVRVGEVSLGEGPPSLRFTEGLPFLDRLAVTVGTS